MKKSSLICMKVDRKQLLHVHVYIRHGKIKDTLPIEMNLVFYDNHFQ